MDNVFSMDYDFGSPASTESGTLIPTPSTSRASRASSISQSGSTNIPSGPLNLTMLSTTSWRQPYPSVGQFAMTDSEEVVAAGPNGLFYFSRVDHATTPWSEPRPLPSVQVTLNEITVSGLALYRTCSGHDPDRQSQLYLYCVSGGFLHSFYLADKNNPSLLRDNSPPLAGCRVMGKPTVVQDIELCSLVVPCQSGGLLHTSATNSKPHNNSVSTGWEAVDHLATDLGIISAVSVTAVHRQIDYLGNYETELVAVCISRGQLNVVQGPFHKSGIPNRLKWEGKTSTRILHPGEVTGNPELITNGNRDGKTQLDLLVPSAEGGIFHFVRTHSLPNDWHMVGRVAFPQNIPPASCLSFHSRSYRNKTRNLYALIQICGRLYHVKTTNEKLPWHDACLNPIVQPGPFLE